MLKYRILLCDADDTLFDFPAAEAGAFCRMMAGTPYADQADSLEPVFTRINAGLWARLGRGEVDQAFVMSERFAALGREAGLDLDPVAANDAFLEGLAQESRLLPGALEAVRDWAGFVRIAIVSNGVTRVQRRRLAASPIAPYISLLITSQELGRPKPDPAMVHTALSRLGEAEPSAALMLGDSLTTDIAAAKAAGVDACWYAPGQALPRPQDPAPDFIARDYGQVTDLLRREDSAPPDRYV